eukprot:TRINITY_DN63706_c0_g1_i1.p1 TRINITY_DN63706_c0_g1~~TRINITY_DN63706_c0_g1_i1.p1  ORF type:complete len:625 (+),score=92.06 TRINITY_DN63706_c0_g1_i1:96-1877(+)
MTGEYAVWYSPGQYSTMGAWVLRMESSVDKAAMLLATQQVVDRHQGMRVEISDPVRYNSFVYDCVVMFALYAPFLDAGPRLAQYLRRFLSWTCFSTWSRIRVRTREEVYRQRFPEFAAPYKNTEIHGGQNELERAIRIHKQSLVPPACIGTFELICYIVDAWSYHRWNGHFVILRTKSSAASELSNDLFYVDQASGEWGPLIGPDSHKWEIPPYGFPALFYIPLNTGAVIWIRLDKKDELRICYRPDGLHHGKLFHLAAHRQNPGRPRNVHEPTVLTYLAVSLWHAFADGNCYLPVVQDLLAYYEAAAEGHSQPQLPKLRNAFEELEKRLCDTFNNKPSPMAASLRGSIFRYSGRGYGHNLGLEPDTIRILTRVLAHYRVPLDVGILGLVICAMARADAAELVDFTLYVPSRDGAAETLLLGLFADWRNLAVSVDLQLATVLGTLLQVNHKIQHRLWTNWNTLLKPEAIIVNIQPLDFEKHAGFMHLGEHMWRDGDRIGHPEQRTNDLPWARQQANFVIEQQDLENWWILISLGYEERPPPWLRKFIYSFDEALRCLVLDPAALVHRPLPDEEALLLRYEAEMKAEKSVENLV